MAWTRSKDTVLIALADAAEITSLMPAEAAAGNHEPLEAPDDFVELYPESYRQDRRWCTFPVPPPRAFDRLTPCALWFARRRWHDELLGRSPRQRDEPDEVAGHVGRHCARPHHGNHHH